MLGLNGSASVVSLTFFPERLNVQENSEMVILLAAPNHPKYSPLGH